MGFQSIFAWKALPEAAFVKKAVIDAHRSKHESIASGWLHRNARPILSQASPVWKVWNLPDCFLRVRESVRRASGFVQTGKQEEIPGQKSGLEAACCCPPSSRRQCSDLLEALDKGEGVVKDRIILSGVGGTAFRQSLIEDQDLQASR